MPDAVGVGLGDAVGAVVGVGVGESFAEGDALALGLGAGVGLVADAAVQPVRTSTTAPTATSRRVGNGMGVQRRQAPESLL